MAKKNSSKKQENNEVKKEEPIKAEAKAKDEKKDKTENKTTAKKTEKATKNGAEQKADKAETSAKNEKTETSNKNVSKPKSNNSNKPKEEKKPDTEKKTSEESKADSKKEANSNKGSKKKEQENPKKESAKKENDKKEPAQKEKALKKAEPKEIAKTKPAEKPKLIEENENRKRRNLFIGINVGILCILVLLFSTIFAFMNTGKSVIINGISIKGIDVSGLTATEATGKITEALNIELNTQITIESDDYETTFDSSQIEFEYSISQAVQEAYSIGRSGNIIQNNYTILWAAFVGTSVDVDYSYNEESLTYIAETIESKLPNLVVQASYYIEDTNLYIVPGTDGVSVDEEAFEDLIIDTIVSLDAVEILESDETVTIEVPTAQTEADAIDIDAIYEEVYTEPQDAYYIEDPFEIFAEVDGIDFAISIEEAKAMVSEEAEEYVIPLTITEAEKTINDIGTEAFPYEISSFTTKYDASNTNRSSNLEIAAGKIDGTVLMPGDEFSFNQVVGKRTIEEGYKDAKIYANGQVVDGLAGGICQISSTLYNAAVQANLTITERRNHSFTTSYVKAGLDATVVYGTIDLKFINSRTYPIKITASVSGGIVEFKIYGIKEEVEYDIQLSSTITETIPYTTQYVTDTSLATGQQVVTQSGTNGYKVSTYKETRLDGILISRELVSTDTYSARNAIINVGP